MADVNNDLIYQVLTSVQTDVAIVKRDVTDMTSRVTNKEIAMGHIQAAIGQVNGWMDTMDLAMDRIEKRLGLTEAPNPAAA